MSESELQTLLFETLNKATHAALSVDPDTAAAFGKLRGKVFCIELTTPKITLYLLPEPDGFVLAPKSEQDPDVTLSGSIFAFAKLAGNQNAITDGQVTMQGDAEAGQVLQKILAGFDFDWEELIARIIGDTPARKVGNAIRETTQWAAKSADLSRSNMAEYLQEEKQVLATPLAMERFETAVTEVRTGVDRLAQRIERLSQTIKP